MLQIHDIIEHLPKDYLKSDEHNQIVLLERMLELFSQHEDGACFDFGEVDSITEETWVNLANYAHDLWKHDMFQLPYVPVYYSWSRGGDSFGAYVYQHDKDTLDIIHFCAQKRPFLLAIIGSLKSRYNSAQEQLATNIDGHLIWTSPCIEIISDNHEIELMQSIVGHVVILTCLMQSTNANTRTTEFSDKLNNKRMKRGLPEIMPFHTVYFDIGGRHYNTDGSERNGSHASPRLHWRRGHIRKMKTGKVAHVRPHLVGTMGTDLTAPKPVYEMRT